MSEFVRVKLPNGSEASVPVSFASSRGLKPLKKPATHNGRVLKDKPKTSLPNASSDTANPSGGDSAASNQEDSK